MAWRPVTAPPAPMHPMYAGGSASVILAGDARTYATWDPAAKGSACTLTSGNLTATGLETNGTARSTVGVSSGKWYWEVTSTGSRFPIMGVGAASATLSDFPGTDASGWGYYGASSQKVHGGTQAAYGSSWTSAAQVIGVALDLTNGTLELFKNGVSMGVAYTGLPAGTYYAMTGGDTNSGASNATANFGATALTYTPPSGFNAGLYQ